MNKLISINQGNGMLYEIPINELFYISFWGRSKVYDRIKLLRQKGWFTNEKCIELCYYMVEITEELDLTIDYEVLKRSLR